MDEPCNVDKLQLALVVARMASGKLCASSTKTNDCVNSSPTACRVLLLSNMEYGTTTNCAAATATGQKMKGEPRMGRYEKVGANKEGGLEGNLLDKLLPLQKDDGDNQSGRTISCRIVGTRFADLSQPTRLFNVRRLTEELEG